MFTKNDSRRAISFVLLIVMIVSLAPLAFAHFDVGDYEARGADFEAGTLESDEIVVYNEDELRSAITSDNGKTTIYLGSDISSTGTSRINIPSYKPNLVIDGRDPTSSTPDTVHAINRNKTQPLLAGTNIWDIEGSSVTFRYLEFNNSSATIYGMMYDNTRAAGTNQQLVTYLDHVVGESNAFHNAAGGQIVIKDSDLTVRTEEVTHAARITLEGINYIQKKGGTGATSILFLDGGHRNGVQFANADYAQSHIQFDVDSRIYYGLSRIANDGKYVFGKYSEFNYYGRERFFRPDSPTNLSGNKMAEFTVNENAKVNILIKDFTSSGYTSNHPVVYASGPINVFTGASLNVGVLNQDSDGSQTYPTMIHSNSDINLKTPKQVAFYNNGSKDTAIGVSGTGNFNFENAKRADFSADTNNEMTFDPDSWKINYTGITGNTYWGTKGADETSLVASSFDINSSHNSSGTTGVTTTYPSDEPERILDGAQATLDTGNFRFPGSRIVQFVGNYSDEPIGNPIVEGDNEIGGRGTPRSRIIVEWPWAQSEADYTIVPVDDDGNWTATFEGDHMLYAGDEISLYQRQLVDGELNDASKAMVKEVLAKGITIEGETDEKVYLDTNDTGESQTPPFDVTFRDVTKAAVTPLSAKYVVIPTATYNEDSFDSNDSAAFDAAYNAADEEQKGELSKSQIRNMIGPGSTNSNGVVWVKGYMRIDEDSPNPETAISTVTRSALNTFAFKNLYELYPISVAGEAVDETGILSPRALYDYEEITTPEAYGLPKDADGSVLNDPTHGYDKVQLKMKSQYSDHWNAKLGEFDAPFTLTLDALFLNNDMGLADNDEASEYTLSYTKIPTMWATVPALYYDEKSGIGVTINGTTGGSISVPLDEENGNSSTRFHEYGGYFMPPSEGESNPVGYTTGTAFTTSAAQLCDDFTNPRKFPLVIDDVEQQNLYITYKTGTIQVQERNLTTGTGIRPIYLGSTETTVRNTTDSEQYTSSALGFNNYVPVGYVVRGLNDGDLTSYFNAHEHVLTNPDTPPNFDQNGLIGVDIPATSFGATNVTITYLFEPDRNNNGISDSEEASVRVRWNGSKVEESSTYRLKDTELVNTRCDIKFTMNNERRFNENGNDDHKIAVSSGALKGVWIFDSLKEGNRSSYSVTPSGVSSGTIVDTFNFDYAYSTDGEYPDNQQYIDTHFRELSSGDDDATSTGTAIDEQQSTRDYIFKGDRYSKMPREIPGYVFVGYRYDGDSSNRIMYANGTQPSRVNFETESLNGNVYMLYREAAADVNVIWEAETYAGNKFTLGQETFTGFMGEQLDVPHDYIDTGSFSLVDGSMSQASITFGTEPQTFTFELKESALEGYIHIYHKSDDDAINFYRKMPIVPNDNKITESAMTIPGYEFSDWELRDSAGNLMSTGTSIEAAINSKDGSQTLTFNYKSNTTAVFVRPYDTDTGEVLTDEIKTHRNAIVGQTFSAIAPYVSGYALEMGEDLLKTIRVEKGTNSVNFNYTKLTENVTILCKEEGSEDIIAAYGEDHENSATIEAPDLSSAYYTLVSDSEVEYDGSGNATVEFYYEKQTKDITVIAVDENSDPIVIDGEDVRQTVEGARLGEMHTVLPIENVPNCSLNDSNAKITYVDPSDPNQVVEFEYTREQMADVRIEYFNTTLNEPINSMTATAVVGSRFSADRPDLSDQGFDPINSTPTSIVITVDEDSANNVIRFDYMDTRNVVTKEYYLQNGEDSDTFVISDRLTETEKVINDATHQAVPKNIQDYVLYGYSIGVDTGMDDITVVTRAGFEHVTLPGVTTDTTVKFYYKTLDNIVEEKSSHVEVTHWFDKNGNGVYNAGEEFDTTVVHNLVAGTLYELTGTALDKESLGYTNPVANHSSMLLVAGQNTVSVKYDKIEGMWYDIAVEGVYAGTNTPVGGYPVTLDQEVFHGGSYTTTATIVPWTIVLGGSTATLSDITTDSTIRFEYETVEANLEIQAVQKSDNDRIIAQEHRSVTGGAHLSYNASDVFGTIPGWELSDSAIKTLTADAIANTVKFEYIENVRDIKVEAIERGTNRILYETTMQDELVGDDYTINAPHINDYVLTDTDNPSSSFTLQKGDNPHVVRFTYMKASDVAQQIMVVGKAGGKQLYSYVEKGHGGDAVTITPMAMLGYDTPASKIATFGSVSMVEFEYESYMKEVRITAEDETGNAIPGFMPKSYEAARGTTYTALAPVIPGYYIDQSGNPEANNHESTFTVTESTSVAFVYKKAEGVILASGIDNTDNRTIKTVGVSVDTLARAAQSIDPSDVLGDITGYELVSADAIDVDYPNVTTVAFAYAPKMIDVTVNYTAYDGTELATSESFKVQEGQAYTAIGRAFAGYDLASVEPPTQTIIASEDTNEITFNYAPSTSSVQILFQDNETGQILGMQNASPEAGSTYNAIAIAIDGYRLVGEQTQSVTVSPEGTTIIFEYVKDTTDVLVELIDERTLDVVDSYYERGLQKDIATTLYAPALPGYVISGEGSRIITPSDTVTKTSFAYKAMSDVFEQQYAYVELVHWFDKDGDGTYDAGEEFDSTIVPNLVEGNSFTPSDTMLDKIAQGYENPQASPASITDLSTSRNEIQVKYDKIDGEWFTVTIEGIYAGTNTPVPGYPTTLQDEVRRGESYTATASMVPWTTVLGDPTRTVTDIDENTVITFEYVSVDANIELQAVNLDNGEILAQEHMSVEGGQHVTYSATDVFGTIPGWKLFDDEVKGTTADAIAKTITFGYIENTRNISVVAIEQNSGDVIHSYELEDRPVGGDVTVVAPHINDYILVDTSNSSVVVSPLEEGDAPHRVEFTYMKAADAAKQITVVGKAGGKQLYSHVEKGQGGDTVTITPMAVLGYDAPAAKTVTFGSVSIVEFEYESYMREIKIHAQDEFGNPIPGYMTKSYEAARGATYTAFAPVIPGYFVNADINDHEKTFIVDQSTSVAFVYQKAEGFILCNGIDNSGTDKIIKTVGVPVEAMTRAPQVIDPSDVLGDITGYELVSTEGITVDYPNTTTAAFAYAPKMINVTVSYIDEGGMELASPLSVEVQEGQAYTAINRAFAGYELSGVDPATQTIIASDDVNEITFTYRASQSTVQVLHKDQETDQILGLQNANPAVGTDYEAAAMAFDGYTLVGDQIQTVSVTAGGTTVEFFYAKSTMDVLVNLIDDSSDMIVDSYYERDLQRDISTTIYAPALPGYVVTGESSTILMPSDEVTQTAFRYKSLGDVFEEQYAYVELTHWFDKNGDGTYDAGEEFDTTIVPNLVAGDSYSPNDAVLDKSSSGYTEGTASPASITSLEPGRNVIDVKYNKAMAGWHSITVEAVYRGTGEPVEGYPRSLPSEVYDHGTFTTTASIIPWHVVIGDATQTLADVTDDSTIRFEYERVTQNVEIRAIDSDTGAVVRSTNATAEGGQYVTYGAIDTFGTIEGYRLVDGEDDEKGITIDALAANNVIEFEYQRNVRDLTIEAIDADTDETILTRTTADLPVGGNVTIPAPHIEGYILDDLLNPARTVAIDESSPSSVVFKYRKASADVTHITVKGKSDSGEELYSYATVGNRGDVVTVEPTVVAGYSTPLARTATHGAVAEIVFTHESTMVDITIEAKDEQDNDVPGYLPKVYTAVNGSTYTAIAPVIKGYVISDDVYERDIDVDGNETVKFNYKKSDGLFMINAVEEGNPSNVIKTIGVELTEGTHTVSAGALGDIVGWELVSDEAIEVTYPDTQNASFAFEKDMVPVRIVYEGVDPETRALDLARMSAFGSAATADTLDMITDSSIVEVQVGQAFTALPKHIPGYKVVEADPVGQTVVARDGTESITFRYVPVQTNVTVVHKVEGTDSILSAKYDNAAAGSQFIANAESFTGYQLVGTETTKVETVPDSGMLVIEFEYTEATTDVRIELLDSQTDEIIDSTEQRFTNGIGATIEAPALPGYMIDGPTRQYVADPVQTTNVSFHYKSTNQIVEENMVTITLRGIVSGTNTELFAIPQNEQMSSNEKVYDAPNHSGYVATGLTQQSISLATNGSLTFEYAKVGSNVEILFVDPDNNNNVIYRVTETYPEGTTLDTVISDASVWGPEPDDLLPGWEFDGDYTNPSNSSNFPVGSGDRARLVYELSVRERTVTVNYENVTGDAIASSTTITGKIGEEMLITPTAIDEYVAHEAFTSYTVTEADDQSVTFTYDYNPDITQGSITFIVSDSDGRLENADITLSGQALSTDGNGIATTTTPVAIDTWYDFSVEKAGYTAANSRVYLSQSNSNLAVFVTMSKASTPGTPGTPGTSSPQETKLVIEAVDTEGNVIETTARAVAVGDKLTVTAPAIDGYAVSSRNTITVTITEGTNKVVFEYIQITGEHLPYIKGFVDGSVRPEGNLTRGEAAAILYRTLADTNTESTASFSDLPENYWCYDEIRALYELGIIKGYEDGTFRPDNNISRSEFTAMVTRFYEVAGKGSSQFTDVADDHWAIEYINYAVERGWINGYTDGTFKPEDKIDRAETINIMNKVLERKPHIDGFFAEIPIFWDLQPTHWAYAQIIEATVAHNYAMVDDIVQGEDYERWSN